ncbi:glycosyltransferase family 9 protein [endosymbiont of Ridgeia piscesae]|uniref:ADP-heptose:LPS heptosyltransferase n=1 Tax=endosymbiont of Ridgeia piscesae TaxID=54398 RepID=A0A0T5Z3V1_9GAMM|nr:glycosyltransferase family 9 protein [endosymbiont of Ridgeia piscesae]KRT55677.1 ADP-heptose:LPS heptosyltransferase [endosymbiont of Ridgeia piscesae]KRT57520.1 heptosyltransferase-3 [endosymbiont of Ridgeia piscesae]
MAELPAFKPLQRPLTKPPKRVLLIATRQIGDVLLATPLLRSMRRAWPEAVIDVLVYKNKGQMLQGNPDLNQVIEIEEHPDFAQYRALWRRIFRRYELAVSTLAGDRPNVYAFLAAPRRLSLIPDLLPKSRWKRWINQGWALLDNVQTHTVEQNLMLARVLGIAPLHQLVPPVAASDPFGELGGFLGRHAFVLLHPFPMWRYKRWTEAGWQALLTHLAGRGLKLLITGGPDPEERSFCERLAATLPESALAIPAGFGFGELAALMRHASLFVGPDTALTHLAAACGTPTLALFGPSNPVKWGPWPSGYADTQPPFKMYSETAQRVANVSLLQPHYAEACVPCREEGCERHKGSASLCLDQLPAQRVIAAVDALLVGELILD